MDMKGQVITEEKAYAKMTRLCARKECAPFDIVGKLSRMGLSGPVINRIIDRLEKEKYIDERRFIRSFIHDKLHFNKWGKRKITLSLRQKQFSQKLIDELFMEFSDTSFGESLQPILEKKWKSVTGKSDYEKRGKLIRYALGRGFSMEEILAGIERLGMEEITRGKMTNETE
ncbi:regulatory protein RecX [Proteiniphilum sp. UBA5384]|uniref:regulatory protein RecX n=1 Tax=Proteiniphilum sp. UBA5384 TaxID=1947279 RepID=UPI0025FBA529|nr:regulatory protein RecX [Proteiniphilum sp. UBA5384]